MLADDCVLLETFFGKTSAHEDCNWWKFKKKKESFNGVWGFGDGGTRFCFMREEVYCGNFMGFCVLWAVWDNL